jgi:hypothetical protein
MRLRECSSRSSFPAGLRRGHQAAGVLERFLTRPEAIPSNYWSVQPAASGPSEAEQVSLRGAVLVHVRGLLPASEKAGSALSPELVAALEEPLSHPGRALLKLSRSSGLLAPSAIMAALLLATGGVIVEAVLFRALFDMRRELGLSGQRLTAIGAILIFLAALLFLELPVTASLLRLGRRLEMCLRLSFSERSRDWVTATSKAGSTRTWLSAATVSTGFVLCRIWLGSFYDRPSSWS